MDTIRAARKTDAPEIYDLIYEAVGPYENEDFDEEGIASFLKPNTIDAIRNRIGDVDFLTLCYIRQAKIVGIITLHKYQRLDQLFVHPGSRNMKIATKLWKSALDICSRNGNQGKYWTKSSTVVVDVYKSFGFRIDGERARQNGMVYYPMVFEINKES